jgi:hypothetical protein
LRGRALAWGHARPAAELGARAAAWLAEHAADTPGALRRRGLGVRFAVRGATLEVHLTGPGAPAAGARRELPPRAALGLPPASSRERDRAARVWVLAGASPGDAGPFHEPPVGSAGPSTTAPPWRGSATGAGLPRAGRRRAVPGV